MTPPDPPPIEDVYDEKTLRRLGVEIEPSRTQRSLAPGLELEYEFDTDRHLDGYLGEAVVHDDDRVEGDRVADVDAECVEPRRPGSNRVRKPLSGMMLAAAMSGVGEVFEPESRKAAMVEFDPGHDHFSDRPVQFVFVPGAPKLSRIVLRPWLRAG